MPFCKSCSQEYRVECNRGMCSEKCRFLFYADHLDNNPGKECWIWKGRMGHDGYGTLVIKGKHTRAHRYSHYLYYGYCNPNLLVLHSCDKKECVNPLHLRQGSVQDNSDDFGKMRGHRNGSSVNTSKLNEENVREIRRLYTDGLCSQQSLADVFKVSQNAISHIIRRKNWKHI